MEKMTYNSEIIKALIYYDGQASLKEILKYLKEKSALPYIHTNLNWDRQVSKVLQEHCEETKSYKGAQKYFYSVLGIGGGVWGLLDYPQLAGIAQKDLDVNYRPYEERVIASIQNDKNISETEKAVLIKARIGQGKFREQLIYKYKCCVVTGIKNPKLLIASHIKPWALCDNSEERLSSSNGLLLSPLFDKLFDSRLISFSNQGKMLISKRVDDSDIVRFNIKKDAQFNLRVDAELLHNLEFHRDSLCLGDFR